MIDEVRINWDYVVIRYIYVDYIKGILKILGIFELICILISRLKIWFFS